MKHKHSHGKGWMKRAFQFYGLIYTKKGFSQDLMKTMDEWRIPHGENPIDGIWNYKDLEEVHRKHNGVSRQRTKVIENIEKNGRLHSFRNEISNLLKKHGLGEEWFLTIVDFLVSGWIYPPTFNLHVKEEGTRVVLVLNPDTSLDDISDSWSFIQERQKKLWPNFRKQNFTKKSFKNLNIAIQDKMEKVLGKGSEIDVVSKQSYKVTDEDLVGKIFENEEDDSQEADRKRKANLRQIRRRFSSKMA